MSSNNNRLEVASRVYTGDTTFSPNYQRSYLFIVATTAAATVEFDNGGGEIPIPINSFYEPLVTPTTTFTVRTAGDFIVVTNKEEIA